MSGKGFIRLEVYLIPVFILHTIEAQVAVLDGNPANQHISRSRLYAACIDEGVSKCAPSFFMHKAPTFTSRGFVIT